MLRIRSGWVDGLYFYNSRRLANASHSLKRTAERFANDPSLGRFLSPDTIIPNPGNPLDYDRYAYVRNAPTMYTDPSGHDPTRGSGILLAFYGMLD